MNKIDVVYEWIGPQGPICNARLPNIYDLALSIENVTITDNKRATSAYFYKEVLSKFPDKFKLKSASEVNRNNLFIYDFQYIYKSPAESLFVFGIPSGLFENSKVSDKVLDGIRNGNGYFLLDFSLESFISPQFFQNMEQYFSNHNIPLHKIIYMTGCPNGEELYQIFCNQRNIEQSRRIKVLFWDSFEWQMSKRQNKNYEVDRNINNIKKTFLSLNYRYRPHRLDLFLTFYKSNLLNSSLFTFSEKNPDNVQQLFLDNVDKGFANWLGINDDDLRHIQQNILPLQVDKISSDHSRHAEMTMEIGHSTEHFYKTTMMSVVTETHAYQDAIAETEKTFKPIKYKHPFILVGAPKSLQYLRKKGYKTFSNWFDESYDDIVNHRDRVIVITNLCKEINSWDYHRKEKFIIETNDVVNHNFEVFKNAHKNIPLIFWDNLGNSI